MLNAVEKVNIFIFFYLIHSRFRNNLFRFQIKFHTKNIGNMKWKYLSGLSILCYLDELPIIARFLMASKKTLIILLSQSSNESFFCNMFAKENVKKITKE